MLQSALLGKRAQRLHAPRKSFTRDVLEIAVQREARWHIEMRKWAADLLQPHVAALGYIQRSGEYVGRVLEHPRHLLVALHEELVAVELHPVRLLNRLCRLNADHHVLRMGI